MNNAGLQLVQTDNQTGLTPRQIKAELVLRGVTISSIAAAAGVTQGAVSQAINQPKDIRPRRSRIRPYIAAALDRAVEDIWPGEKR